MVKQVTKYGALISALCLVATGCRGGDETAAVSRSTHPASRTRRARTR